MAVGSVNEVLEIKVAELRIQSTDTGSIRVVLYPCKALRYFIPLNISSSSSSPVSILSDLMVNNFEGVHMPNMDVGLSLIHI